MDYTLFYKKCFEDGHIECRECYDYFLSAYDGCERTINVFAKINSQHKIWIDFPQYKNNIEESGVYKCNSLKEDEYFSELFETYEINPTSKICIDITGFIRPHLIFLYKYLYMKGIKIIDFLYTEPEHYAHAEETNFSGFIDNVKIVEGCGSEINNPNTDNDILIITAGYDDKLIAKVAQVKSKIKKKYYILGLPSLQPDMYQECILKIYQAKESIGKRIDKYAPACDPFVTAQVIDEIIEENKDYSNIYLSPLSTKPQVLGVAFYYLWNYKKMPINIIFPYSNTYPGKTAHGIKKTWVYTCELP